MVIIISKAPTKCIQKWTIFQANCPGLAPELLCHTQLPHFVKLQLAPQSSLGYLQHLSYRKFQSELSQSYVLDVERVKTVGKLSKMQERKKMGFLIEIQDTCIHICSPTSVWFTFGESFALCVSESPALQRETLQFLSPIFHAFS